LKSTITHLTIILPILAIFAQTPDFVKATVYQKAGDKTTALSTTNYSDGVGKVIQTQSTLNDNAAYQALVGATIFDEVGRPIKTLKTFPVATSGFIKDIITPATAYFAATYSTGNFFNEIVYHNDPLSRVKEVGAPGDAFAIGTNHTSKNWYCGVGDEDLTADDGFGNSVVFTDGLLTSTLTDPILDNIINKQFAFVTYDHFLIITKDPNGKYSQELKNKFGDVLKTVAQNGSDPIVAQNAYDILGNLVLQTPPSEADVALVNPTDFEYNSAGQLIRKKLPDLWNGTWSETYDYNSAGQLIGSARPIQKDGSGAGVVALATTYDELGRVKETGRKPDAWPAVVNFYDGLRNMPQTEISGSRYRYGLYDCLNQCEVSREEQFEILQALESDENARGTLTATFAINYLPTQSGAFPLRYVVADFYCYDFLGQITKHIKLVPTLPLHRFEYQYDLMGRVTISTVSAGAHSQTLAFEYDPNSRLVGVYSGAIAPGTRLVTYVYDETGRVVTKKFNQSTVTATYGLKYDYTINDWLTTIATDAATKPAVDPNSNFSEQISYTDKGTAQYNGNISAIDYTYGLFNPISLQYGYDDVNRLVSTAVAALPVPPGDATTKYGEAFDYDNIGRFKTKNVGAGARTYAYYPKSTRLKSAHSGVDVNYLYDFNGNMVYDGSKKMVIRHDWRNLPITFELYNAGLNATILDKYALDADYNGTVPQSEFDADVKTAIGAQLRAEVIMLYDAGGNRVLKVEK
jgi:hypothetical protein